MLPASLLKFVNNDHNFSFRESQIQEIETIVNLRTSESSRLSMSDYHAYKKYENCEFWSGFLQQKFVGTLAFIKYDENLAYLASYYVLKQFRSQGYGLRIWDYVINRLKVTNLSLNAEMSHQAKYLKIGFKTQSKGARYILRGNNIKYESDFLINCAQLDFQVLENYDRQISTVNRSQFLKHWISLPKGKAIAFVRNNKVEGYGVLRKIQTGYKIGPLFANTYEIALQILKKLVSQISEDTDIIFDTPGLHEDVLRLVEQFKMNLFAYYARMFTNGEPQFYKKKSIYGITSIEFG